MVLSGVILPPGDRGILVVTTRKKILTFDNEGCC